MARNDTSRSIAHRYLSYCATTTAPDNPGGLVLGGNSNDGWMDVESKGQFFGTNYHTYAPAASTGMVERIVVVTAVPTHTAFEFF